MSLVSISCTAVYFGKKIFFTCVAILDLSVLGPGSGQTSENASLGVCVEFFLCR